MAVVIICRDQPLKVNIEDSPFFSGQILELPEVETDVEKLSKEVGSLGKTDELFIVWKRTKSP